MCVAQVGPSTGSEVTASGCVLYSVLLGEGVANGLSSRRVPEATGEAATTGRPRVARKTRWPAGAACCLVVTRLPPSVTDASLPTGSPTVVTATGVAATVVA